MTCHNTSANHVLGVKTHQLNGELDYPHLGEPMNQLTYLNELGVFNQDIGSASRYDKAYPIDDETIDLDLRIRSYFDANCASCHRHGALPTVHMDLQFHTPLILKNIIGVATTSNASDPDRLIIQSGDHSVSEFWLRDASITQERMPPLARNLVDEIYVDKLAEWIDGLSPIDVNEEDNIIFPNPTDDWLGVRFGDSWEGPFDMRLIALDGRLIHQATIESTTETLDLSILPSGIYLLELSSFNGRREIARILVY